MHDPKLYGNTWTRTDAVRELRSLVMNPATSAKVRIEAVVELEIVQGRGERDSKGRFVPYPATD